MERTISTPRPFGSPSEPGIPGFEQRDGEWRLRLDYYETFIQDVTGVDVTEEISTKRLKTIQNRLEGCVEVYKRENSCSCDDFHRYEHVDSIETVQGLGRFFRVLIANRLERVSQS